MKRRPPYRIYRRGYIATAGRYPVGSIRPTRAAAGMTHTASRGGGPMKAEASALAMFGTLDPLRRRLAPYTERQACLCCGAKTRLALSATGVARLAQLRKRRANRWEQLV